MRLLVQMLVIICCVAGVVQENISSDKRPILTQNGMLEMYYVNKRTIERINRTKELITLNPFYCYMLGGAEFLASHITLAIRSGEGATPVERGEEQL